MQLLRRIDDTGRGDREPSVHQIRAVAGAIRAIAGHVDFAADCSTMERKSRFIHRRAPAIELAASRARSHQ
jgi:hypothetical protein